MAMRDKQRALDMFDAVINGKSYAKVGSCYLVCGQRVRQLVFWLGRIMLHPDNWKHDNGAGWGDIKAMRENKEIWLEASKRLRAKYKS